MQRFVDLEIGEPVEYLMGIEALSNENADGVFEALKKLALKVGITEEDFEAKVCVATMDGASVNMGDKSNVKTRLIESASQMSIIHCCNHSLELVVSYAARSHKDVAGAVAMYDNYALVVDHLGQMSNAFADFTKEDRDKAADLLKRIATVKFVMFMHVMIDLLDTVGKVSVLLQSPKSIILDIPGYYDDISNTIFNVQNHQTPNLVSFFNQFDGDSMKWKDIKLSGVRSQRGRDGELEDISWKLKCVRWFGPFIDDIQHNLAVRFGIFVNNGEFLSLFKIFNPANWPTEDAALLRNYGSTQLEELLQKSPDSGIGDYFSAEEIANIKTEWPGFKIRMKDFAIRNDKGPLAFYRHFLTSQALSAQFFE